MGIHLCIKESNASQYIGDIVSAWTTLNVDKPQGPWLDPRVFLIFNNDLETFVTSFKFLDDVTLTETLALSDTKMRLVPDQVVDWSHTNFLNINIKKMK
jgi:hypothetical protein